MIIKKTRKTKGTPDLKTRPVKSTDFGFKNSLTIFVNPNLTDIEITEKFKLRLEHEPISHFRKAKML